ncbi:hypothetical protein N0V84_004955 [Fusarium piperis]|uniref:Uncharacterized protein n=1 Tax=Fusarium piperis TaxID=1435070 RepID=A0A9W8WEJ3_9HYPO|nr:hypothetical protein N0V84_004955 [Fusarium piperis]
MKPCPVSALGKRPRAPEFNQVDVEATCIEVFQEHSAQQRQRIQSELDDLKNEMMNDLRKEMKKNLQKEMKKNLQKEMKRLKEGLKEYSSWRINELDPANTYSRTEVDDLIAQAESESRDLMDIKVDDGILRAKGDMEEHIKQELQNAEEQVLRRLGSARWVLDDESV